MVAIYYHIDGVDNDRTIKYGRIMTPERDPGVENAIAEAGGMRRLAERLGMAHATISRWKKIPAHHVLRLEQLLNIPRHELRPDLYPEPPSPPQPAPPARRHARRPTAKRGKK